MHNPKERGFMNEKDETDYLPNQLINMLILLDIDLRRNFINNIINIHIHNGIDVITCRSKFYSSKGFLINLIFSLYSSYYYKSKLSKKKEPYEV